MLHQNSNEDTIAILRLKKHQEIQCQREKSRENLLSHNRPDIVEAKLDSDVSLHQAMNLIQELSRKNRKFDKETLKKIKNSCCQPEFIEAFFKINGAFCALTHGLKSRNAEIQLETVSCFTNFACGSHKLCFRVAKTVGAYLVSLIGGSSHYLQSQCAWAVRNIVNDCLECYSKLKAHGVFPALLKALMSPMTDCNESVIYGINACLKYADLDLIDINKKEYSNYLLKVIDEKTLPLHAIREASSVLANGLYLASANNYDCSNFNLVKLLKCLKESVCVENNDYLTGLMLIRCLGYLSVYDSVANFLFSDVTFHEIILRILNHSFHILQKEVFWVLTNISVSCVIEIDHCTFEPILKTVESFLNPINPAVLTVLYYLCCTISQNKNILVLYQQLGLLEKIKNLASCGNNSIENASQTCLKIIQNYTE